MLKFTARDRDGKIGYFFGLSRGNIDRLTAGQPIAVNLADMGGPDIPIRILFDETEVELFNALQKAGMIPSEVEYRPAAPGMAEVMRIKREKE